MPSAQPTCAARVIRSKFVQSGWGATLSKETNDMVSRVKPDAEGMYQLQIARDRPISATTLRSALFWEHRHLIQQSIVSTPAVDDELELELFSEYPEQIQSRAGFEHIKKQRTPESIKMHPIFKPIRDREFTLWNVRVDGVWVTLFFRVEPKPMQILGDSQVFDREVTRLAIIDSLPKDQDVRRKLLEARLPAVLGEGCIYLPPTSIGGFEIEETTHEWSTGHVAYAASREIFRRLKVLLHRRQSQPHDASIDFLWSKFEENHDVDAYRQLIMAACANRTIENTNYNVRIALEVPSEKSNHVPSALQHVRLDPEIVPDELYTKIHYTTRNVVIPLPNGHTPTSIDEIVAREQSEDSDSEMSDADDSEPESPAAKPKQKSPVLEKPATEDDVDFEELLAAEAMDDDIPEPAKQSSNEFIQLKRTLSIEESDSDQPSKKQKIEEETPTKSSTQTPLTPGREQKEDVTEFAVIDSIEHDSSSPDTYEPTLGDEMKSDDLE
ncbi:hypothetical protein F4776DRAFT_415643 [Hypoxylon sp. NC0597]|nr:hypothetical protein F4776DRAFT_415643 [Hypoxylon sp. NC0597]